MPNLVYHGTAASNLPSIRKEGIQPRGKRTSNWDKFPSIKDMVYLSKVYAPYFATSAVENASTATLLIVEVDLDRLAESKLYPDEDFVGQMVASGLKVPVTYVHEAVVKDIKKYRHTWPLSIEKLGNVAYRGTVPLKAITRYATFDCTEHPMLTVSFLDPQISPLNYAFCGAFHGKEIAWIMGDEKELPQLEQARMMLMSAEVGGNEKYKEDAKKAVEFWIKESSNRQGITVGTFGK